jgi:hypothetical protein
MKSPADLKQRLAQQWQNNDLRERRLLSPDQWPLELAIAAPSAKVVLNEPSALREHLQLWRNVEVGEVEWDTRSYRGTSTPLSIPVAWRLHQPSEWIAATERADITREYQHLARIVEAIDSPYHSVVLRQRAQVLARKVSEVVLAAQVASELSPGCAAGRPLRALSLAGCDSKFYERNRHLLTLMLCARFGDTVLDQGLEHFLDATDENDHWLLVAPLQPGLLPFAQQRVRARELMTQALGAKRIVIVENEQCLHQLPELSDAIAILGAGLHLNWMQTPWLTCKQIAYWGDIDTWGLSMLAAARSHCPHLTALLMTQEVFDDYGPQAAVVEQELAGSSPPEGLSDEERELYLHLVGQSKGRLEQEFLPQERVAEAINETFG